jgi:hypothetical protein
MLLTLSLTPGLSQVIAAQTEVRNRLNGFRIGFVSRFTWLKPGVNGRSTATFPNMQSHLNPILRQPVLLQPPVEGTAA